MAMELISQGEYARRRGVTKQAVSKAVRRCRIPLIDGKIDPLVADTLWRERTDPLQQQRALGQQRQAPAIPADEDVRWPEKRDFSWRERKERAEAQMAEIMLKEREGRLCDAEMAQRRITQFCSALKAQLEPLADRISAEFGTDDAMRRAMRQRIRDEIAKIRTELVLAGRSPEQ